MAQIVENLHAAQETLGLIPGSGRSPGVGNGNSCLAFLPGECCGQRSLAGYSPWGHRESDMTAGLTTFSFSEGI